MIPDALCYRLSHPYSTCFNTNLATASTNTSTFVSAVPLAIPLSVEKSPFYNVFDLQLTYFKHVILIGIPFCFGISLFNYQYRNKTKLQCFHNFYHNILYFGLYSTCLYLSLRHSSNFYRIFS